MPSIPACIAGLPGNSATVWVGPPLFASEPNPGFATPTLFPLLPSISPPEPPVPIRLFEPETAVSGKPVGISLAPLALVFPATIELFNVRLPRL